MIGLLRSVRHPAFAILKCVADGDVPGPGSHGVTLHLTQCAECGETLRRLRALRACAATLAVSPMRTDMLHRILARGVAAGPAFVVPLPVVRVGRKYNRWAIASVAAAILLLATALLFRTPAVAEAGMESGDLQLRQTPRGTGVSVVVTYRPSAALSGFQKLRLRANYSYLNALASKPVPHSSDVELSRGADGIFHGAFRLPDSAVYGRFAVERRDAKEVDSNQRQLWDLLVRAADGRPRFEALWARYQALGFFRWEEQFATARKMAALYPDRPEGWRMVMGAEIDLAGPASRDSITATYGSRFRSLHDRLSGQPVSAEVMSQMVFFASAVRDTTRERYWRERAVHENPTDPATVQQRVFMVYDQQHSPETRLEAFERLWREAGGQSIQLGYDAFNLALRSGDATLVQRWGDRILASHPEAKALVGINYADIPVLRARGMDLIRAALRHLTDSTDDRRPLEDDAARYRIAAARGGQGLLLALGKALLREGQSRAALDTLDKAIGLGWNVGVFRATAEAELAVGDSSMAARWLAFAAADPTSAPSAADSTRARLGARIGSARWTAWVDTASRELRQEILAAGERVRAVTDLGLVDTVGLEASIGKLAQDRPSVIAFVSRECPPSLAQLASLQIAASKLRNAGVPLLTIVREVPNAVVVRAFRSRGFALPLYFDTRGRASRALGQVGTPHYFVFDPLGGVRFESRSPDEILRQVAAIQGRPLPRIDAIRLPVTARPAAAR